MIVADTNLLLYFYVFSEHSLPAEQAFNRDADWAAPFLWRSEFRNALMLYLRKQILTLEEISFIIQQAETLMRNNEYEVSSTTVINLAASSGCSAYDCEFVAVAQELKVPLVTVDKKVIRAFPETAIPLEKFVLQ